MMSDCGTVNYCYIQNGGSRFDILKFGLALIIVTVHSGVLPRWTFPITRLAVPLFFIMTSYFFFLKVSNAPDKDTRNRALKKYVKRNAQLYLFWSIVLLPCVFVLHLSWFREGPLNAFLNILKSFFITEFFPASWFILAAIYTMIIVYVLSKWLNNSWLLIIALILYPIALLDSNYGGLMNEELQQLLNAPGIRYSLNIPAAMIWIVIGKMLAEKPVFISPYLLYPLLAIMMIVYYIEFFLIEHYGLCVHSDCYLMSIPISALLFMAIGQRHDIHCPQALWLRKSSIIIYCLHLTLIQLFSSISIYYGIERPKWATFIVTTIICIAVAYLIIYLNEKKNVKWLSYAY